VAISSKIGCDVGGTFTDMIILYGNKIDFLKIPSTPRAPELAASQGITSITTQVSQKLSTIEYISHATTLATNALISNQGLANIGLITTKGFRDLIEIGRQIRPDPYSFFTNKPRALIPRYLRKEVTERVTSNGDIHIPLNEAEVHQAVHELLQEHVEAIAVCTLFSFLNPVHEIQIAQIIHANYPDLPVSLSHQVLPEFREYERSSTVLINTLLLNLMNRYLHNFEVRLSTSGFHGPLLIMQSNGRIMTSSMAREKPVYIIESGPAAGAIAAAYLGQHIDVPNLVSLDMGGTTAKVCLVENGQPSVTTDFEVGGELATGRIRRGSGWPIKIPMIDLIEIGAGGGSIAWIDAGGALKVGPQSAGADPGPACYPQGGQVPTVTDACVVLGIINPTFFLGGNMIINSKAATAAIRTHIADPLGLDVIQAANGILDIAISNMQRALRIVTLERGRDPRDLVLLAFGGAGPMVAGRLTAELHFNQAIVPETPGLFSAYGLLVADIGHDYVQSILQNTDELSLDVLNDKYDRLQQQGLSDLRREGFPISRQRILRSADLRFEGQSYEIEINIPSQTITATDLDAIEQAFLTEHARRYGFSPSQEVIELVNIRVSAIGSTPKIPIQTQTRHTRDSSSALKGRREVFFPTIEAYSPTPIFDRYRLHYGNLVQGPAIIEQQDSTIVVNPDQDAHIDHFGQVIIKQS
jgi:N-methylhydantoinase A